MAARLTGIGDLILQVIVLAGIAVVSSCVPTDEIAWIGFSPSDRYLACVTREGRLIVYDLEKRQSREITTEAAVEGGFEWSPVGERLAFCLRQKGRWDLAVADPAGTITRLTDDNWRDLQPTWSPDGRGIYYVSSFGGGYARDYDIRYYDLVARQSYPIIRGPHDQVEPRISPDGRWLAAISYQHGNPIILIHALKTTRAIQISPPPTFRGARLRSLSWLGDSRRLLYEAEHGGRHHLVECDIEKEKSEVLGTSQQPFESVTLDRRKRHVLYVSGGRAFRCPTQPRWGRIQRLAFDNLSINCVAVRHNDDRVCAVVDKRLLASASASGRSVRPFLPDREKEHDQYLRWGDLELQRGHSRAGFGYYGAAFDRLRERAGDKADEDVARAQLSRASLLCRLGHSEKAAEYLREAQRVLEKAMDQDARNNLYALFALNEYIASDRNETARTWIEQIPPDKRSSETAVLLQLLNHSDLKVRRNYGHALTALWQGRFDDWARSFERLLRSRPHDPVVQAACDWMLEDFFGSPFVSGEDIFHPSQDDKKVFETWARMVVRYHAAVGDRAMRDQHSLDRLELALVLLHDADGLKRLVLQHDRLALNRSKVLDLYGGYCRMEELAGEGELAFGQVVADVFFNHEVLVRVDERTTDPLVRTIVRLARARHALVEGELEEMKRVFAELDKDFEQMGSERLFSSDRLTRVTHTILKAELAERLNAWDQAVRHYREAADMAENLLKEAKQEPKDSDLLSRFLHGSRFRADLLQRGVTARNEIADLFAVERGVGDRLVIDSRDPTSLRNGIHNYFSLLDRVSTAWIKDLIFLKAGQCYRGLGRWCEAGFCLRVAAQSRERFVARYARAQLSELYRALEDPGLANF